QPHRPPPPVQLDSSLERDLGLDSLGRAELLLRVEAELGTALPARVLGEAETPRDLLRALASAPQKGAVDDGALLAPGLAPASPRPRCARCCACSRRSRPTCARSTPSRSSTRGPTMRRDCRRSAATISPSCSTPPAAPARPRVSRSPTTTCSPTCAPWGASCTS